MNRRPVFRQAVNFSLQSVLSVFIKSPTQSVLPLVSRCQTEIMVQLHKASLIDPGSHSQKMFDLLELAVSMELVRKCSPSSCTSCPGHRS